MTCRWCRGSSPATEAIRRADRSMVAGAQFFTPSDDDAPIALQCARCSMVACESHAAIYFRTVTDDSPVRVCVICYARLRKAYLAASTP